MDSPAADGSPAPDPELIERFAAGLRALWRECGRGEHGKAGLAVSGGPDSTALLLLAASAFPDQVEAATVSP
jgi:tRNA(Ile)-lysidine synthase